MCLNVGWLLVWHGFARREIHLDSVALLGDAAAFLFAALLMTMVSVGLGDGIGDLYLRFFAKIGLAVCVYPSVVLLTPQRAVLKEAFGFLFRSRP